MVVKTYKPKRCERCGETFTPTSGRSKYCEACGPEVKLEQRRKVYRDRIRYQFGFTPLEGRECPDCQVTFDASGPGQARCPDCQRKRERKRARERHRERWANDPEYRERHLEWTRERRRRRKVSRISAPGHIFPPCVLCGEPIPPSEHHEDHVLALARFGDQEGYREVLLPTHGDCNRSKGTKTLEEILGERDAKIKKLEEQLSGR